MSDSGSILYELVRTTMHLCRAESAGVSILESDGDEEVFRWHAITGKFAANAHQSLPRDYSPCGLVIKQEDPTLIRHPERCFSSLVGVEPAVVEALLVPFYSNRRVVGTLCALFHSPGRQFDSEDARLLTSLSLFASTAFELTWAESASRANLDLSQRIGTGERQLSEATNALREEIAHRTHVEAELRDSEERYRVLFESMDQGFYIVDVLFDENDRPVDIYYVEGNPAAIKLTGLDFTGRWMSEIDPDFETHWLDISGHVARTGESVRDERYARPLGKWFDFFAFRIGGPGQNRIAVFFNDTTKRKRAEKRLKRSEKDLASQVESATDELRRLSQRLMSVQEAERRYLAHELHDEIGQALTGLTFSLDMARRAGRNQHLDRAAEIAQYLVNQVRALTLELRPPVLDDMGLIPALIALAERITMQTGVRVDLHHEGAGRRYPGDVETAAYRIVQEALTNIARHSESDLARVHILVGENLTIRVTDDGPGFNVEATRRAGNSSGLIGMQDRASLVGGTLTIESLPGAGTSIMAELPLDDVSTTAQ